MKVLNLCVLTNDTAVPLNLNFCHKVENGKGQGNICSHSRDDGLYQEQGERQRISITYQLGCPSRLAAGGLEDSQKPISLDDLRPDAHLFWTAQTP